MSSQQNHILLHQDSMIILDALKHELRIANISCIIKSNSESARLAGFFAGNDNNQLFVYESDAKSAKKILEDFFSKKV